MIEEQPEAEVLSREDDPLGIGNIPQGPERDKMIRSQLQKLVEMNPKCVPVYFIVNQTDPQKIPNQIPLILFGREATVDKLVVKMKQKFKQYPHVYLFGKDRHQVQPEMSLREKRKFRGRITAQFEGQKIIYLDKQILEMAVGDAFDRFHSQDKLLVVVVSRQSLELKERERQRQVAATTAGLTQKIVFFIVCLFLILYLYISFSEETTTPQGTAVNPEMPPTSLEQ